MNQNDFKDVPDDLWALLEPLLPSAPPRDALGRGRPRVANRRVMAGILFRLRTGCQWKALPYAYGSGSTCHLRFQSWVRAGAFDAIYRQLLNYYDNFVGIDWEWASLDGAMVKAPKGGRKRGKIPRTGENSE